ncbi:MAG TPA: transcription elongation factor GreB [Acidiferrobacterales bacterium]|nr:transcription elongation factor GreB [Acidiferrobacterales bacterium]
MGRQRLPQPASSNYITPEGMQQLRDELNHLWRVERPSVTQAVSEAAAQGDRSENAEYIYGKKRLREIDRRVRYLQKRIPDLQVVDRPPDDPTRIFFGAWIKLEDEAGKLVCYRIVGPDEFDPAKGWISIDSPLARALLKKTAGDEVRVTLPTPALSEAEGGEMEYCVVAVQYTPFEKQVRP